MSRENAERADLSVAVERAEAVKDGLTHTEGGHATDSHFSDDHGQSITECRTCGETLLVSRGADQTGDEKLRLTFIKSTEERQYQRHHEGHFCSPECLVAYLTEEDNAE